MVSGLGTREGENRRRKEHCLVIGMRYQETYSLVLEGREAHREDARGVDVEAREDEDEGRKAKEADVHGSSVFGIAKLLR